jgi:4-hydroxy-tetrahydrodipicolinate synthase
MTARISGVLAPVVTPFRADLAPDVDRWVAHCRWLLANDVGLAVFGTNSEANSLAVSERADLLERLVAAGVDPGRLMPGTGTCALTDTLRLTAQAVRLGCAGVLMLPPFYYKGVSDEGLFRSFAAIIEGVGDARLAIYLYHIPAVSQVPISLALIERLLKAYPGAVAGIKDSSGDWANTQAMLTRFQPQGFDVFTGSETFLLANLRHGGRGCISATANVNPAAIAALHRHWQDDGADAMQASLDGVRSAFQKFTLVAALKAAIAHWGRDPDWLRLRPPLVELTRGQAGELIDSLEAQGFSMPGLQTSDRLHR